MSYLVTATDDFLVTGTDNFLVTAITSTSTNNVKVASLQVAIVRTGATDVLSARSGSTVIWDSTS